jgi:hypothetical protein
MGWVKSEQQKILDHYVNKATLTPETFWIALYTGSAASANDPTGLTEVPNANGYARVAMSAANWASAVAGAAGVPSSISNGAEKAFAAATGNWASSANITHWGLVTSATHGAGSLRFFADLDVAKPVLSGDTPTLPVGAMKMELGLPADTFS